ncbi:N-acetylglucosamine kinase [Parapedobacter sp. DT-150]|uniref:N-acetylglucosamine kinase n=1 Tax=Parapedobacter sp. DT-150 TaxID=3396162 RepID=UPI003F1C080E
MILIADSGSTKTDWAISSKGAATQYFTTTGYNPFFMDAPSILASMTGEMKKHPELSSVEAVYFYGAGCQGEKRSQMEQALTQVFAHCPVIRVEVDLLAAAHALLGDSPGFAAILGTGTNTCLYNGKTIVYHIDSLGFLLGDEGSGAAIGKRILVDFLRHRMPPAIRDAFMQAYRVQEDDVMQQLYSSGQPNRYSASFARFLDSQAVPDSYRRQVVSDAFDTFFAQLVSAYPDYGLYSFNCVGSIGFHFRELLEATAGRYGMKTGKIIRSVIEQLVDYHSHSTE